MLNSIMAFSCDAILIDFFLNREDWNITSIDESVTDSGTKWMIDLSCKLVLKELKAVKD